MDNELLFRDRLGEVQNWLAVKFPGLCLEAGLFYQWPIGIRFELGGRGPDSNVMSLVQHRAKALFEAAFSGGDVCTVVGVHWEADDENHDFQNYQPLPQFDQTHSVGLGRCVQEWREEFIPETSTDPAGSRIYYAFQQQAHSFRYDLLIRAIANTDHGLEPKIGSEIFFLDRRRELVVHMYDDRGLDVIATARETIRPLFESFNDWILDYDRIQIEQTFSQ